MTIKNRQWLLKRFVGADEIVSEDHYELKEQILPELADGQILVKITLLGTSPAQRMYVTEVRKFHFAVELGEVMSCRGIGVITESKHPDYKVGEVIQASLGWQDYVILTPDDKSDTKENVKTIQKIPNATRPLTTNLGLFGQLAFSAYVGVIEVGQIRKGDVAVISSAAGGVGSIACQLAKIQGASKVVGIAGGKEKCQWLVDQGLCDAAIDYKSDNVAESLATHCPDGIDFFLDNVGGDILDDVLNNLSIGANIILCGHISTEYQNPRPPGPTNYYQLIYQRARMAGFFVFDHIEKWPAFEDQLRQWYKEGQLKLVDHVYEGLEEAPTALRSLFTGGHTGGCMIRIADDPETLPKL